MAARKKQALINLLPSEEFAGSTTGRLLAWALSTFRYIVIATELIVIVAFISRFWLDAKNSDLRDEIEQKQSIILGSADFEKEYREVQLRMSIFNALAVQQISMSDILTRVSSSIPEDVFLSSITIAGKNLRIEGLSPSERSIVQFEVNLKKNAGYPKVEIILVHTNQLDPSLLEFLIEIPLAPMEG